MAPRQLLAVALLALFGIASVRPAIAAWSASGTTITAASGNQLNSQSVSDGAGGVFVVWEDARSGSKDIYAAHFSHQGTLVSGWTANGTVVCNASGNQTNPVLIADGSGGAFIAWQDQRGSDWDIRAIRMTSSGGVASGWTANGNSVCSSSGDQQRPTITTDGITGFVVAWDDTRSGSHSAIYAMRILSNGDPSTAWTTNGIQVSSSDGVRLNANICATSDGCTAIGWEMQANQDSVEVQKVNVIGALQWANAIRPFSSLGVRSTTNAKVAPDNSGGVFVICKYDNRSGSTGYDVYAERITSNGAVAWNSPTGLDSSADEDNGTIVADGTGKCLIACERGAINGDAVKRISSIRLGSDESISWGRDFGRSNGEPYHPTILPDGSGGGIFGWRAASASTGAGGALEAVRVNSAGAVVSGWSNPTFVMAMSTNSGNSTFADTWPQMVTDGLGGMIMVTPDKASDYNIYAEMVGPTGTVAPDVDPPAAVTDLGAATAKFTLVATWTAPADAPGGFSAATAYDLRISTAPLDQYTFGSGTQLTTSTPQSPGSEECLTVTGLSSCTDYWLAIKSVDANGNWSAVSNISNPKTKCSGASANACDPGLMASLEGPGEVSIRIMPTMDRSAFRYELSLPTRQSVRLDILDVAGRIVSTLADGDVDGGITEALWDGKDRSGARVGSGIYFARLLTATSSRTTKVVVAP